MNILVTNYERTNENIMVFSQNVSVKQLTDFLNKIEKSFTDITEVQNHELQYHIYDPLWMDDTKENFVLTTLKESK